MSAYSERQAEYVRAAEEIAAAHAIRLDAIAKSRGDAEDENAADRAALEEAKASSEADARMACLSAIDAGLVALAASFSSEPTNAKTVELMAAFKVGQVAMSDQLGSGEPTRRFLYAFAEAHRIARPGIVGAIQDESFWLSTVVGTTVIEAATPLRHAVERWNVADFRTALEKIDAIFWGVGEGAQDAEALAGWQARIDPDPRVQEAYAAVQAERAAEAKRVLQEEQSRRQAEWDRKRSEGALVLNASAPRPGSELAEQFSWRSSPNDAIVSE